MGCLPSKIAEAESMKSTHAITRRCKMNMSFGYGDGILLIIAMEFSVCLHVSWLVLGHQHLLHTLHGMRSKLGFGIPLPARFPLYRLLSISSIIPSRNVVALLLLIQVVACSIGCLPDPYTLAVYLFSIRTCLGLVTSVMGYSGLLSFHLHRLLEYVSRVLTALVAWKRRSEVKWRKGAVPRLSIYFGEAYHSSFGPFLCNIHRMTSHEAH